ncbi:hypothetical protein ACFL96_07180 [Thermoproteota archaeon]
MGGKLLVVEDMISELIFGVYTNKLKDLKAKVDDIDIAMGFDSAMRKIKKNRYDFFLLDYDLEGLVPGLFYYFRPGNEKNGIMLAEGIRRAPWGFHAHIHMHSRRVNAGRSPAEYSSWQQAAAEGPIDTYSAKWVLDDLLCVIEKPKLVYCGDDNRNEGGNPKSPSSFL